jgi:hypothetical protein
MQPALRATFASWEKLLSRPDVAAAIAEVGRREQAPMFNLAN